MGHIGSFDQDLDAFDLDDVSVWDRVRSLAPSVAPVPGRLFGRLRAPSARLDTLDVLPANSTALSAGASDLSADAAWSNLHAAFAGSAQDHDCQIIENDDDPVVQAIDLLRSRLMPVLKKNHWTRVAIVSPEAGCGSSYLASNIAARLSRVAAVRTVLMDLNLRQPCIANLFGLQANSDAVEMLSGLTPPSEGLVRFGKNLALGLVDAPVVSSVETLSDPRTRASLEKIEETLRPDVMLFDVPPMLTFPDMTAFLPFVDAVLIVADGTRTNAAQIAECERAISGQADLLGVVLNKARDTKRKSWFRRG